MTVSGVAFINVKSEFSGTLRSSSPSKSLLVMHAPPEIVLPMPWMQSGVSSASCANESVEHASALIAATAEIRIFMVPPNEQGQVNTTGILTVRSSSESTVYLKACEVPGTALKMKASSKVFAVGDLLLNVAVT